MVDFNSYVFSKAAAARILNRSSSAIAELYRKADHIIVTFNDGSWNQAINCSEFKRHFAEYRRQQGQQLQNAMVDPNNDSLWYVGKYQVQVHPDHLTCTCHDYRTQEQVGIKTPTCKHAYAVLHKLGCNSLAEFVESKQNDEGSTSPTATNQSGEAKTRQSTLNRTKCWKLVWQSYALDPDEDRPVPMETRESVLCYKPSQSQIDQMRKAANSQGFRLADIKEQATSTVSEI